MNITEKLVKETWKRRTVLDGGSISVPHGRFKGYKQSTNGIGYAYIEMTQDDFLNEISSDAHPINSRYMSQRPIYAPTGIKDKNGNEQWAIQGYDDLEKVALGLQECISSKKTSHFAADGFWTANETEDKEAFSRLMSWADIVGLKTAYMEMVYYLFREGDAAIFLYQTADNEIEYQVFAYEKGDILYPNVDEDGNPCLYRKYTLNGKEAVDEFTTKEINTWVRLDDTPQENQTWFEKMRKFIKNSTKKMSEDGYTLILHRSAQISSDILQVVYFRIPDIPTGVVQQSIETLENACSYVAEEMKDFAFPILFLKSEKIINLPPSKINGKTIGVKGTTETIKNSDAKFLAPPDASNIATIHLKNLQDNIFRTSMTVFIDPEILKSGADSSSTMKILFAPEIQWCQKEWIFIAKPMRHLMKIFKHLVGKAEGDIVRYSKLKLSVGQNVWIPQNEKERVQIELDQVYARVKSRQAAMEDIGNTHINDAQQVLKEWEEELRIKSEIPAKVKQQYGTTEEETIDEEDNPNKPRIDNKSLGKSISQ